MLRTIAVMQKVISEFQDFVLGKNSSSHYPISPRWVFRIMIILIVLFALLSGYYQGRLMIWRDNNIRILEKFDVNTTKELLDKNVEVK